MFVEYDCLHFRSMYLMLIEYTKNRIKNTCWYLFKIRAFSKQNHDVSFFFLSGFSFTDTAHSQDSRGKEGTIFYSTLSLPLAHEHSDIYFATLHVRCLSHVSNRTACIYQAATRWDLPPYRITILSDWWYDVDFCLFTCWFDSRLLLLLFDTGNPWTRTRMDYHTCITSEPTNQVC